MKVRIKFSKQGAMKFIGHLDTMRYFQKAIRRADIPVAYSDGFSPHMIMSFAAPLGVGVTSRGEYFDMELAQEMEPQEITHRLDAVMTEGVKVCGTVHVEDGKASKAMSLVAACDYYVAFRPGDEFGENWQEAFEAFSQLPSIIVHKKTKRSEKDVDIRPHIYEMRLRRAHNCRTDNGQEDAQVYVNGNGQEDAQNCEKQNEEENMQDNTTGIFLKLASASSNYTKPDQVMAGFAAYMGAEYNPLAYTIERLEVYADTGTEEKHQFVPLDSLGI